MNSDQTASLWIHLFAINLEQIFLSYPHTHDEFLFSIYTGQKFAMLEEKVVLSTIFRNFNVKSLQRTLEDLNPVEELILRPENGIIVALTPRN